MTCLVGSLGSIFHIAYMQICKKKTQTIFCIEIALWFVLSLYFKFLFLFVVLYP